jgi:hypothetical protein
VIGLPLLESWLSDYAEDAGIEIESVGLVYTLVRGPLPRRMRQVMQELRTARGDAVFKAHLSVATAVAQSVEAHEPIFRFRKSRNGRVGREIVAIIKEFLDRVTGA